MSMSSSSDLRVLRSSTRRHRKRVCSKAQMAEERGARSTTVFRRSGLKAWRQTRSRRTHFTRALTAGVFTKLLMAARVGSLPEQVTQAYLADGHNSRVNKPP